MVQRLFALLSFLLCVAIIFVGSAHLRATIQSMEEKAAETDETGTQEAGKGDGAGAAEREESNPFNLLPEQLELYTETMPEHLKDRFLQAYEQGEPLDIVFAGSPALGSSADGWSAQVKKALEDRFGSDFVHVEIVEFDGTSTAFVEEGKAEEIAEKKPDIVLFEALTLEDNGLVTIDDSLKNIRTFAEALAEENPDALFLLQPPNPIYNAKYYPVQVEELRKFAETQKYELLDHWKAWPDPNSEAILDYLDDGGLPNEKGHELWAKFIKEYFGLK
nr:hypothetical protein [Bacillaceae bacterium]